jgi:hypothetical protein
MKQNRKRPEERFVKLRHWVLDTAAWRSLDPAAIAVYLQIAKRYTGSNNGRIAFSVRQAAKEVGPKPARRGMCMLQARGFIVATKKGAFNHARHATEWRLTEFKCDVTGEAASEDFRHQQPASPASAPRKTAKPVRSERKAAAPPPPPHPPAPPQAQRGNGAARPGAPGVCAQCHCDHADEAPILLMGARGHPEGVWLHHSCMRSWAHENPASVSPVQH